MAMRQVMARVRNPARAAAVEVTAEQPDSTTVWLAQCCRLAAICWMDLDDELVREFVAELEPAFRLSASAPLISVAPHSARRLLLGRNASAAALSQPANSSGTNDVTVTEDRTGLAALRWRRRTPSAFASD
eukprot:809155-Prymnesium_polylepis.1